MKTSVSIIPSASTPSVELFLPLWSFLPIVELLFPVWSFSSQCVASSPSVALHLPVWRDELDKQGCPIWLWRDELLEPCRDQPCGAHVQQSVHRAAAPKRCSHTHPHIHRALHCFQIDKCCCLKAAFADQPSPVHLLFVSKLVYSLSTIFAAGCS